MSNFISYNHNPKSLSTIFDLQILKPPAQRVYPLYQALSPRF